MKRLRPCGAEKPRGIGKVRAGGGAPAQVKKKLRAVAIAVAIAAFGLFARAADDPVEAGTFTLFKFEQAIGTERYEIRPDGNRFLLTSNFSFTDRGTGVALDTTFQFSQPPITPTRFAIKGDTARLSTIDLTITEVPPATFTLAGYAPVSMQMELLRYWTSHGRPASVPLVPQGAAHIEPRGRDTISFGGRTTTLDRFSVTGVLWGRETLWADDRGNLQALVSVDAEFDHFEAVRPELQDAVPQLIARAASDGMAAMAETAAAINPPPAHVLAITGGTVIDVTGKRRPLSDATVVVIDGQISAVGAARSVKVPAGATVIDATGKTLIPGLWDMHAHFEQVEWGPIYLASGVTTVRDVGNELEFITSVRDAIASGKGVGPRLLLAGIVDGTGPNAMGAIHASTPDEGRDVVRRYKDAGFDQIKIYSSIKLDVLRAITMEAHRLGMTVTGHVPDGIDAFQAIAAGMDQINHIEYVESVSHPDPARIIAVMKQHHTVLDPTMALYELLARPFTQPIDEFEPGFAHVARELTAPLAGFGSSPDASVPRRRRFDRELGLLGELHRAGVPIVAGTDQSVPGFSLHREMELYVKAGFKPLEALQSATIVPAKAMGKDRDSGSIEVGKRGDIVILDANPLDDIANARKIFRVVTNGRVFSPGPLWESVGFRP
jgi:imidazolonepropionase-like amidohydrolase